MSSGRLFHIHWALLPEGEPEWLVDPAYLGSVNLYAAMRAVP
jgi:hypothetical protein